MITRSYLPQAFSELAAGILWTFILLIGTSSLLYLSSVQISRYFNPLRKLPYPPGPPPRDVILGNARDLVTEPLWLKLTDWAAKYGSVIHFKALHRHLIVISSLDDAIELMEKRSNNYSDRPYIPIVELTGANFATSLKSYGPPTSTWHAHRRLFQQFFRPRAVLEYKSMQVDKVNDMLYSLLDSPEDFMNHIRTLSVSIIMSMAYGYKVSPKDDRFREIAEEAMFELGEVMLPGASIVNILPFLRFLPSWFPGTDFHRVSRTVKEKVRRLQDVPYRYVRDNVAAGTASPSFVANLLETCESEDDHTLLKEVAATAYGAGSDTTTSAIITFVYAMARYPDIQRKAQEELDRVIGIDRLANYGDEGSLPYLQAIYREVLRWKPVTPLGIFHATIAEDVYNGYYISKGAMIIPNIWAMTRDPLKYQQPENFNPERFIDENNKLNSDDVGYVFGFGRRICPGRHMAASTIWLAMATILSTFDIQSPKDVSGKDIPLDVEYGSGLISQPHPFKCIIRPRSVKAEQLVIDINNGSI